MKYSGAEILVKTLIDIGIDTVFGYPGGAVLDIYDKLYDYQDKIIHYQMAHEQGASHAADGFARSTGKTGVVIATSGPGATNLVTGIATAYMDSVPMVAITGNVASHLIGKDSFQEIFITGITMPITKHNYVVRNVDDLQRIVHEAFRIANTGRKGPVLIDIPKDIMNHQSEYNEMEKYKFEQSRYNDQERIRKIAHMINESERPIIYSGGGVSASNAHLELRELIEKNSIPACNTIMGIGILGEEDDLKLGMVGMHGKYSSNMAMRNADLVIAIGTRFSDRVALNPNRFAEDKKVIHIDIDLSEINKNVIVDENIIGDVKDILTKLNLFIEENPRKEWIDQVRAWKENDYKPVDLEEGLSPHQIIRTINENTSEDLIYVTDVGQHQMWTAQYCRRTNPRSFLTSGGLGTMGFGYGAAIGAKIANPEKPVVLVTGDGSFHMNLNECSTSVLYNIPVIVVIMKNHTLGMVRQWQHYIYKDRYSQSNCDRPTDFKMLAEAFGADGYAVQSIDEFQEVFVQVLKSNRPTIIECPIDIDSYVLPMIPAGGMTDDMIME